MTEELVEVVGKTAGRRMALEDPGTSVDEESECLRVSMAGQIR